MKRFIASLVISSIVMIKNSRYIDFFPYPAFRTSQEKIIQQIEESARSRKNIFLKKKDYQLIAFSYLKFSELFRLFRLHSYLV